MIISIIAAIAENNVIGNKNKLIWHISSDLKRFKKLTVGHSIIMGRKTFESIGKPLPDRTNIIITRNKNYNQEKCIVVNSLEEALKYCSGQDEVFIIGGASIYKQSIDLVDKLYLTHVNKQFEGDAYFPEVNFNKWLKDYEEIHNASMESKFNYIFANYIRK